jgi:hypothetical protein
MLLKSKPYTIEAAPQRAGPDLRVPIPQTPDRGWGRHFYSDLCHKLVCDQKLFLGYCRSLTGRRVRSLELYSLLADGHYFVHPNTKISKAPELRLAARVTLASPPPKVAADNVPTGHGFIIFGHGYALGVSRISSRWRLLKRSKYIAVA